eukprot:15968294-Heterocapsa_arctica.AAC.1
MSLRVRWRYRMPLPMAVEPRKSKNNMLKQKATSNYSITRLPSAGAASCTQSSRGSARTSSERGRLRHYII